MNGPIRFVAASLVALAIGSCGGDSTGTPAPVATVTVTPNPASVGVGATVQLAAALEDASGNALSGRPVTWSSDAGGVATVNGTGLVTGVAAGTATITAESEGQSDAAEVTVSTSSSEPPIPTGQAAALVSNGAKFDPSGGLIAIAVITIALRALDEDIEAAEASLSTPFTTGSGNLRSSRGRVGGASLTAPPITSSVLFAGGYEDATGFAATRRAMLYDPAANTATNLQMAAARIYYTLTQISGSRALLAGGFDGDAVLSSAEIFTESTKSFALTGSMGVARGRHAAAPLPDGRILVTGGLIPVGAGPDTIDTRTTEIFDPAAGSFSPGPDMTVARFNHSAIALDDGRVLVLGGNGLTSAEVYDPVAGGFSAVGDMEVVHGLGHRAVKLLDGRVLVLGGDGGIIQPTAAAEVFDPDTDEFARIDDMTSERMLHFAVLLEGDGKVLIGGGQDADGELLASMELFDPVANSFTATTDMPVEDSEQTAVFVQR